MYKASKNKKVCHTVKFNNIHISSGKFSINVTLFIFHILSLMKLPKLHTKVQRGEVVWEETGVIDLSEISCLK